MTESIQKSRIWTCSEKTAQKSNGAVEQRAAVKSWSGMKTPGDNVIGKDTDWEPDI